MRYDQWWECKFIAEGIIDQGEALREHNNHPALVRVEGASEGLLLLFHYGGWSLSAPAEGICLSLQGVVSGIAWQTCQKSCVLARQKPLCLCPSSCARPTRYSHPYLELFLLFCLCKPPRSQAELEREQKRVQVAQDSPWADREGEPLYIPGIILDPQGKVVRDVFGKSQTRK